MEQFVEQAVEDAPARTRKDAELFIHLRLETAQGARWLADADVAQAAETALAAQARLHLCQVLAVGSGADHLHALLGFPVSLPLNRLIRQMQQVSSQAAVRALRMMGGPDVTPEQVWSSRYQLDSLSQGDVGGLVAYVCHHPAIHTHGQARPEHERPQG